MVSYWGIEDAIKQSHNENCIYYNRTNHIIITDLYEGIPQNLILNFVAWLVLILLFTLLRKRAGNYGRLALVQKADDNLKWTHIFFGAANDSSGSQQDHGSSFSSIDSTVYQDSGVFSWVVATYKLRQRDIIEKCGPDAAQYIAFQKHVISFMVVMMVLSVAVVLPVNFQGNLEGGESAFGHTTISNLNPDSPYLWVHLVLSLLYLPLAIALMRRFSVKGKIQESRMTTSKTVLITNIPKQSCDSTDLHRHFREAFPHLSVQDIQLAFNIQKVSKLDRERDKAYKAKVFCEQYLSDHNVRLQIRPYPCGYVFGCCPFMGCNTVDAIEFYTAEEERLLDEVDTARTTALKHPLGIAFVSFETVDDAKAFFHEMKSTWNCASPENSSVSSLSGQLQPHRWGVNYSPLQRDIFWENLSVPSGSWYFRAIFINLVLFILCFFLTTPAYIVNLINSVNFNDAIKTINPLLSQFLPTLILWTAAALLPVLVAYSDQWLLHWTRSEKNYSIMIKTFSFLLFMVLILPSIGLTSAKAFIDWTWHLQNETYRWECLFLPDKGAFFVNYVTTSTFIGTSLELIRFPELFVYAVRICLTRSKAEHANVRKDILWEFPFGVQYAWMLLIFAMTTMYSLTCPLITPFGLLYMILKHFVDKHNIFFVYTSSKISSEIHATAINCVILSVLLVQASFFGLSYLRSGFNVISIFALAGFVLTIFFFSFNVCFSCCKGFSPISFEVNSDSAVTSPARMGGSQWFVPDVLNIQTPEAGENEDHEPIRSYGTHDDIIQIVPDNGNRTYQQYQSNA